jgi:hypothetical protein
MAQRAPFFARPGQPDKTPWYELLEHARTIERCRCIGWLRAGASSGGRPRRSYGLLARPS